MKQCVIIQGPLYDKCIPYLLETYKTYPDKFISTWNNEDPAKIKLLEENGFTVIVNEIPQIKHAVRYQEVSIQNAIKYIKTLETYTHVLRIRTDIYLNDIEKLMKIYETYNPDKPVFLTWYKHETGGFQVYLKDNTFRDPTQHGYLMNHIIYGTLEFMYTYFNTDWEPSEPRWDEVYHQEFFFKSNCALKYRDIKDKVQVCINKLIEEGIKIYYSKPGKEDHPELLYAYTHSPARYVGYTEEDFIE